MEFGVEEPADKLTRRTLPTQARRVPPGSTNGRAQAIGGGSPHRDFAHRDFAHRDFDQVASARFPRNAPQNQPQRTDGVLVSDRIRLTRDLPP
jgi:hypothetical protein